VGGAATASEVSFSASSVGVARIVTIANKDGASKATTVQITSACRRRERLRRPDLRKASGFPGNPAPFVFLRAGWKAEPSSLRGGGCSCWESFGKAKPFRKSGRQSRSSCPMVTSVIWTSLQQYPRDGCSEVRYDK
jgi:hypothetical protein